MGAIEFVFAVSKDHPLALIQREVSSNDLLPYPTIVVSDTSSTLSKRTTGVVSRQTRIIVPTMEAKIQAQAQGLGVGYVPRLRVEDLLNSGKIVEINLAHHVKKKVDYKYAWNQRTEGPSMCWFLNALSQKDVKSKILSPAARL